jgi:hypothetical protein
MEPVMEERTQPAADEDPAPIKHTDAERVSGEQADPEEIENDPSNDPPEQPLRDVKGG